MCGVAEAGLAITAIAAGAGIAQAQQQSKFQEKVAERDAKVEQTNFALREEERRIALNRQIAAAKSKFGAGGTLIEAAPLASIAGDYARESTGDRLAAGVRAGDSKASAENAKLAANRQSSGALFDFADSGVSYLDATG